MLGAATANTEDRMIRTIKKSRRADFGNEDCIVPVSILQFYKEVLTIHEIDVRATITCSGCGFRKWNSMSRHDY
jgi:hypothetical protein